MRALTYSIVLGNKEGYCDNQCRICISTMTPDPLSDKPTSKPNESLFKHATNIAMNHKPENVLFTSKRETANYPGHIGQYLSWLRDVCHQRSYYFDRIELQTSGVPLAKGGLYDDFLDIWKAQGLSKIAISIYHYLPDKNKEIFRPRSGEYFDLSALLTGIHKKDLKTRLSCVMLKEGIDNPEEVKKLIQFAKENEVSQLTLRMADKPEHPSNLEVAAYVDKHRLGEEPGGELEAITEFIEKEGRYCYPLPHGAKVYEVDGQNVCLTTGLTPPPKRADEEVRQLIFFPQGLLSTSWENPVGSNIL